MKYYLVLTIFFILNACNSKPSKQSLSDGFFMVDSANYNIGHVKRSQDSVVHTFRLTNVGIKPIIINYATGWCDCITISYPRQPIHPKTTDSVTVKYHLGNRWGMFKRTVVLYTNASNPYLFLSINGVVE